ncbi:hypothetical protein KFU94_33225 [Chloroflexi bacterium TSY]|nr:hypothetical protein [Chloroflexi bacterium TSY]
MKNTTYNRPSSKLDAPAFLLFLVVSFMLWSIGLVDLLAHTSENPDNAAIGPYSKTIAILLIGYGLLFVLWLGVLLLPRTHEQAAFILHRIQACWWLTLPIILSFIFIGWTLFTWPRWSEFPGLRTAIFLWFILCGAILVLSGWKEQATAQPWRKFILTPVIGLLLFEGGLQLLLYGERLPDSTYINAGLFAPYGRIYQNREGASNGTTNNYGWYYPDFKLEAERTILLLGDTFIQALQIAPEQHLGVHLQSLINTDENVNTEVIALGMPGFGPGLYLSETRLIDMVDKFNPDEVVLFFHLSDDFQTDTEAVVYDLNFTLGDDGYPQIHRSQIRAIHDLKHYILPGYQNGIDPLGTLSSHFLTSKLLTLQTAYADAQTTPGELDMPSTRGVVLQSGVQSRYFTNIQRTGLVSTPGVSNFLFGKAQSQKADHAIAIAKGHIKRAHDYLSLQGVSLRLVTIPAFPRAFFTQPEQNPNEKVKWSAKLASYDLLRPERALEEFAREQGIPFLAMGQQFQQQMSVNDIEVLYFDQGQGHFTPDGHGYFAQAVYDCFYPNEQIRNSIRACIR